MIVDLILTKVKAEQETYSSIHDENVSGMDPVKGIELKIFSKDLEKAK